MSLGLQKLLYTKHLKESKKDSQLPVKKIHIQKTPSFG